MKQHIKSILAGALLMASSSTMLAQYTETGYFTQGYLYRHELNPALDGGQGYVSLPTFGNMNFGLKGSLNMQNFIYNVNGKTTTFMNPAVSTDEVLKNIKDMNKLMFNMKMQILSFGFKGMGGYNTFGINLRTDVGVTVPGSLFRLAKEGVENKSYDLSGLNAYAKAFVEVGIGHSHKITDDLTIGAKAKFLIGAAAAEARFTKAAFNLNPDGYWDVTADAEVLANVKGMKFETEPADNPDHPTRVSGVDIDTPGLGGMGVAFDLGAEYKIMDGLTASAAITDLGFINWSNTLQAKTYDNNKVTTDAYIFSFDDDSEHSFSDEMEKLGDDLQSLVDLQDKGDQGSRKTGIGSTMRIGVEYKMPFYDKLSVGLLNTTRFQKDYGWTDFRLSANIAPLKAISLGVNYAYGTFGSSFGWILDIHPKGFNLFLTMDHTLGKLSKQFVPLSSNAHLNFGINFPF